MKIDISGDYDGEAILDVEMAYNEIITIRCGNRRTLSITARHDNLWVDVIDGDARAEKNTSIRRREEFLWKMSGTLHNRNWRTHQHMR